jgi:hypothetical protein
MLQRQGTFENPVNERNSLLAFRCSRLPVKACELCSKFLGGASGIACDWSTFCSGRKEGSLLSSMSEGRVGREMVDGRKHAELEHVFERPQIWRAYRRSGV